VDSRPSWESDNVSKEERVYVWNETGRSICVDVEKHEDGHIKIHLTKATEIKVMEDGDDHVFDVPAGDE